MPDYYDRIRRLADQVQDLFAAEGVTVLEMRDVFKALQERTNREKVPPRKTKREGGEQN
ncbi:MAG: hypothetical protein LBI31_04730 [Zoogloeaceae bacterium]|nr:hypothetical protein [Zoogloeaceae bacterium]